jgi:hypothetical protein
MKISAAIVTVVTAFASFATAQGQNTNSADTYDYVIVGGGVGGKNKQSIRVEILF